MLAALPPAIGNRLDGLTVAVEDEPPPGEDAELLGLYVGNTVLEEASLAVPPLVLVFQGPHQRQSRTYRELRNQVAETVLHELGHHFGLEERDLERIGPLRFPTGPARST